MKRTFLTILPIAAALLLATSCSKDSDDNNVSIIDNPQPAETIEQPAEQPAETTVKIPFTVKVGGGESLSKIGYALQKDGDNDIWNKVTRTFDDDDLAGGTHPITLTVNGAETNSGITESTLSLKKDDDGKFYFEGDITVDAYKKDAFNGETGIALVGEFTVSGTALPTSSDESLAKLMESCAHTYKTKGGEFTSKSPSVTLYDQNVYLAIQMSPLQHNIDVTIGDAPSNYPMNSDGQVWIALAANTAVSTNFLSKDASEVVAGHIYTIDRSGFVDLGITDGTLWADANVTGENSDNEGTNKDGVWYYTFDQAQKLGVTLPTGGKGNNTDFKNLYNECYWVWDDTDKGYNVFKKKSGESPTYSADTDPHIFLPAAGRYYRGGAVPNTVGSLGDYWSSTEYDADFGFRLAFVSSIVLPDTYTDRDEEFPVRAVRRK
ncbi:MAG: hypothetical protein IKQ30_03975 [Bacteroidales bacterium]|nr:hypothetical protein [Bacteroidales bacterium]